MTNKAELTLLYDGLCPICSREVRWLRRLDKKQKLGFKDITEPSFNAAHYGVTYEQLSAEIHAQYADGQLIKGMPVFRALYKAVGLAWLLAPTGWPVLRVLFDLCYQLFAQHRKKLGKLFGREKACQRCFK
ncbi:MAG: DUF393 domain-containing protein [Methyloprofundus sp.]|nr:DUF393 domain-containing protein [Methyloprofundus sp.]